VRERIPGPDAGAGDGDVQTARQLTGEPYGFRPATVDDLPMLRRWLHTPEVVRWWGDPDHELSLLTEDLSEPNMVMRIVSLGARPFAYAQHYDVHAWPQDHLAALPAGTRAIDTFIGDPDMLGGGHGSRYLRQLANQLLQEGAPLIAIDPGVDNHRAHRAYWKAGFRGDTLVETPAGPAILMTFDGRG
jgi:aminoglycoside 6'-N-acetyltransferase